MRLLLLWRLELLVDIEIVSNLLDEDLMQSSIVINHFVLLFAVVVFAKGRAFFDRLCGPEP